MFMALYLLEFYWQWFPLMAQRTYTYLPPLGVAGFTYVLFTSEYWSAHERVRHRLLIALIVLPLYMASLVRKLHAAWNRRGWQARQKASSSPT